MIFKETEHLFGSEIIERRLEKVRLRMYMLLKLVPLLDVGEIASSLAGDHDLPSRPGHLFQHDHTCGSVSLIQLITVPVRYEPCRSRRCHKPGGSTSDYNYISLVCHKIPYVMPVCNVNSQDIFKIFLRIYQKIPIFAVPLHEGVTLPL